MIKLKKAKLSDNNYQEFIMLQHKIVSDTITGDERKRLEELKNILRNRYVLF